jgi:hypothetical protein
MAHKDPRIDAIIEKSAPFARPILKHLRRVVHRHCPKAVETLKWGMPTFLYGDRILCGMAGFKAHCALWFWEGKQVVRDQRGKAGEAMGQLGRITSVGDLPAERKLASYIKRAMKLNEPGAMSPTAKRKVSQRKRR